MELAFINRSSMSDGEFAFAIRAVNIQMRDHFMPAWAGRLPGEDQSLWPCVGYASAPDLDAGTFSPIGVLDDIGRDDSLGYHDYVLGAYGRSLPNTVTFSHEAIELRADPFCNLWVPLPGPGSRRVALEVGDPVQNDVYNVDVDLLGIKRSVPVSNFVYPSWFDPNGRAPYDHMGLCTRPFENRGYLIVREPDGGTSFVFASRVDRPAQFRYAAKTNQPWTRTYRRMEPPAPRGR